MAREVCVSQDAQAKCAEAAPEAGEAHICSTGRMGAWTDMCFAGYWAADVEDRQLTCLVGICLQFSHPSSIYVNTTRERAQIGPLPRFSHVWASGASTTNNSRRMSLVRSRKRISTSDVRRQARDCTQARTRASYAIERVRYTAVDGWLVRT